MTSLIHAIYQQAFYSPHHLYDGLLYEMLLFMVLLAVGTCFMVLQIHTIMGVDFMASIGRHIRYSLCEYDMLVN